MDKKDILFEDQKDFVFKCAKCCQKFYHPKGKEEMIFYRIDLTPTEWPKRIETSRSQYHGYICLDCKRSILINMNLLPDYIP